MHVGEGEKTKVRQANYECYDTDIRSSPTASPPSIRRRGPNGKLAERTTPVRIRSLVWLWRRGRRSKAVVLSLPAASRRLPLALWSMIRQWTQG